MYMYGFAPGKISYRVYGKRLCTLAIYRKSAGRSREDHGYNLHGTRLDDGGGVVWAVSTAYTLTYRIAIYILSH